jgi:hypothetical protein
MIATHRNRTDEGYRDRTDASYINIMESVTSRTAT